MNKWLIAGATAAGLVISSAAMARVDVGISIGVPGVVYPAAPVYVAPPPPVAPAPVTRRPACLLPARARLCRAARDLSRAGVLRGGGRYWHDRGGYYRHGDWGTVTATAADPARSQQKPLFRVAFSSRAATPLVS